MGGVGVTVEKTEAERERERERETETDWRNKPERQQRALKRLHRKKVWSSISLPHLPIISSQPLHLSRTSPLHLSNYPSVYLSLYPSASSYHSPQVLILRQLPLSLFSFFSFLLLLSIAPSAPSLRCSSNPFALPVLACQLKLTLRCGERRV